MFFVRVFVCYPVRILVLRFNSTIIQIISSGRARCCRSWWTGGHPIAVGALVRRYDRKATPFYRFSMQTNACVHKMTIWCNNQNGLNLFLMRLYIHIRFNIVKCVCECLSMFRFRVAMNIQYWSDFFDGNAGNLHEPEVMAIYSFHSVGADCLRIPNAMRMLKKWAMVTCSMTILQAKERDSSIYTGQS